jgi:hypothetical protein
MRLFCVKMFFIVFVLVSLVIVLISSVSALSVVVRVPEKYTNVVAGERVYFEVDVKFPENPERKDLRLEYEISDEDGELIAQSKTLKAIETQASFIDFIVIPDNTNAGLYFIDVNVRDYEDLSEKVGASFYVLGGGGVSQRVIFWLIVFALVFIIGVIIIYFEKRFKFFWNKFLIKFRVRKIVKEKLKS